MWEGWCARTRLRSRSSLYVLLLYISGYLFATLASCRAGVKLLLELARGNSSIAYPRSHCRRIPRVSSLQLVLSLRPLLCCVVVDQTNGQIVVCYGNG